MVLPNHGSTLSANIGGPTFISWGKCNKKLHMQRNVMSFLQKKNPGPSFRRTGIQ
jgi:hypothetical protein